MVRVTSAAVLALTGGLHLHGQAVLTVTPGATAGTVAGTGTVGYSGDNGPAVSATFASPSAVAYDASGNLYIADSNNNVVRMVSPSGTVTTVAGTGQQGFGGDGGLATSALLDTPTGIAVDAHGNLYIADSHNNRIREVSGGTITTIAGNGVAGFSGDGGAATSAGLDLPSAVAVDASGNLYIADTNNDRIREVSGGTISTVAGNGVQSFAGDGGAATAASLDSPTGVAVDASGNLFIADRHNQRIREVSSGVITTVAGSGAVNFSGSYSGDGGSATAATLARPSGIAIDAAGNLYIADTDNQRLRKVGGGAIATIAGSGTQGYGGDAGAATAALLNTPRGAAIDGQGNVVVADELNQRLRSVALPELTFPSQGVGVSSAVQYVTLANSGTGTLVVQSMTFTGSFQTASGGTCSGLPISLTAGASCTQAIVFFPSAAGNFSGNVVIGGSGVVPQTLLLSGSAGLSTSIPVLSSTVNPSVFGTSVTFTATMPPSSTPTPTGTLTFYDGATALGEVNLSGGSATYTTAALTAGTHSITAVYGGDAAWSPETSLPLTQTVAQATPTLQWSAPAAIAYGTALSATQLDATANVAGTFTYSPAAGAVLAAGTQTLSVTFTPNDTTDYTTATASVHLVVNTAGTTMTVQATPSSPVYGTPVQFTGTFAPASATLPASDFSFVTDQNTAAAVTIPAASYAGGAVAAADSQLHAGRHTLVLNFAGTADYAAASSPTVTFTVQPATPVITWATPAPIVYGTALSGAQLDATASVPGALTYSPAAGAVLAGGSQTLTVTFTPTDSTDYSTATKSVTLGVEQAMPGISLTTSASPVFLDNPVTLTATMSSSISAPTGTLTFFSNGTALGSAPLSGGVAVYSTSTLVAGSQSITAVYSGDTNFASVTSTAIPETVEDFSLTLAAGSITSATVVPGGTATYQLVIAPLDGTTFPATINLSASGLPSGAVATFAPATLSAGSGTTNVTLTVTIPQSTSALEQGLRHGAPPILLGFLLLPFAGKMRRTGRRMARLFLILTFAVLGLGALTGLTGCSYHSGYFAQQQQSYTVDLTGTSGPLTHSATVTLKVE